MKDTQTSLWKYDKVSGLWVHCRVCGTETAKEWLALSQKDEPGEKFKISKSKPRHFTQS